MFPRVFFLLALAVSAAGQSVRFQWVQQIGGSQSQSITGVASDSLGNSYVVGNTASLDFPVKSAVQPSPGGSGLFRFDSSGQAQNLARAGLAAVSFLVPDPADAQSLYALSGNRLLASPDAGDSWSTLATFDAAPARLAPDPSAPSTLYLGTAGAGILKSTDRGLTWTSINNGLRPDPQDGRIYVYGVWVDPHLSAVLFANTSQGLARSSDAGASWSYTQLTGLYNFSSLVFDPATPGVLYAAAVFNVEKSTDDGVTWTALSGPASQQFQPTALLLDPAHPGTIYAGGYTGLWKSADGGSSWTEKFPNQVFTLAADPQDVIYFANNGTLYRSVDGLSTIAAIGPVLPAISTIAVLGSRVLVGTQGNTDVFVAKFDPQGNLLYATYFGGSAGDQAAAMTVDTSGAVYVTGTTQSSDFPVSPGAYSKTGASFLFKLHSDGSLDYSTHFAPAGNSPIAIAVDPTGSAYLAGVSNGNLPVTPGAYQTSLSGTYTCCNIIGPGPPPVTNGFVTRFDPSGSSLAFSTYFGSQSVTLTAMALAPNGDALLAAGTHLYRLSADGASLPRSADFAGSITTFAVAPSGDIYAGGATSNYYTHTFPISPGAFQAAPPFAASPTSQFAFVTRFDSDFQVTASTLLAGENGDLTLSLALAPDGSVFAGGSTFSKAFPSRGAAQGSFSASTGFLTELSADLTSAVFSTFAGDTRTFSTRSLSATPDGGVLFAGSASNPAPAIQQAFVGKASPQPAMPRVDSVLNAASRLGVALSPGVTFVVTGAGFGPDAVLLINGAPLSLLAHDAASLTAALPLDFTAAGAVTVTVQSGGAASNPYLAPFLPAAPGIFSVDGTGQGRAYALNADGTPNSPSNPSHPGAPITIFATGVGHLAFTNGYAVTDSPVIVAVDGFGAPGIAAVLQPAPGLPGDVYQISVHVPDPASFASVNPNLAGFVFPPMSALTLQVNGQTSQYALWLAIAQ